MKHLQQSNSFLVHQPFLEKLTAISVSTVAYIRGLFPEEAFSDREFEGLQLKVSTLRS